MTTPVQPWMVVVFALVTAAACAAMGWRLRRGGPAVRRPLRVGVFLVLTALLLRLPFALGPAPAFSDDIYRYLFDGQRLLTGHNPFAGTPADDLNRADAGDADPPDRAWVRAINNPELATIYQPASQWVFAGLAGIDALVYGRPMTGAAVTTFRVGFAWLDAVTVALLVVTLVRHGRSPWLAALYAWHPLVIVETGWSGHQDAVGVAFLVAGLVMLSPREPMPTRRVIAGAAALALAVAVKPLVLLVLPWFVLNRRGLPWSSLAWAIGTGTVVLALLYVPFALMPGGFDELRDTSARFVEAWRFNGSLHPLAEHLLGDKRPADGLMLGVLVIVTLTAARACTTAWHAGALTLTAALLLTSTAHPWYALWPLGLLPMMWNTPMRFGGWTLLTLSATLPLAYTAWLNDARFQPLPWAQLAAWQAVYAVLLIEAVIACRRLRRDPLTAPAR